MSEFLEIINQWLKENRSELSTYIDDYACMIFELPTGISVHGLSFSYDKWIGTIWEWKHAIGTAYLRLLNFKDYQIQMADPQFFEKLGELLDYGSAIRRSYENS